MILDQKYRRLAECLARSNGEGTVEEQAQFYFLQLSHLEIDLLISEIQVSESERQIMALESKLGQVSAEHQSLGVGRLGSEVEGRRGVQSSSEQLPKQFGCPLKDCGKRFQKQSGLRLHTKLLHSLKSNWTSGSIFKLQMQKQL